MKAYIAGKVTGDGNYREKFAEAEARLKSEGFIVLNPAVLPEGLSASDYMKICFAMIDCADIVAFLPDWDDSRGARLEHGYCQYVSRQTHYLRAEKSERVTENENL